MTSKSQRELTDEALRQPKNDPADWKRGASLFEQFGYKFTRKLVGTGDTDAHTNFDKVSTSTGEFVPTDTDLQYFDPDNPQHEMINAWDQDAIYMYGLQMRYYKIKPIEDQQYFNEMYGENPAREYEGAVLEEDSRYAFLTEMSPMVVFGLYDPSELTQSLTEHGTDTKRTATIWFNRVYIRTAVGRDPILGDVIIPWDIPEQVFEVVSVEPDEKTLYVPRRWKLGCSLLQVSR